MKVIIYRNCTINRKSAIIYKGLDATTRQNIETLNYDAQHVTISNNPNKFKKCN
jgi:hypothetical protein